MKVTLSVSQLNEIVDLVSRFVSKHSTLQILENIYIKGVDESLIFRATDMEKFVEIRIPAQIEEEGALTINAKTFSDIIKTVDDTHVQLTLDPNKEMFTIKTSKDSFKIKGISANEYVAVPEVHKVQSLELQTALFSQGIEKVEYAVTEKNFSPVLTGVFMRIKNYNSLPHLVFVGTDSFRLAEYKIPYSGAGAEMQIIIPKNNCSEIKKLSDYAAEKECENMEINLAENLVSFSFMVQGISIMATSVLIQGQFPDYDNENIMPTQFNASMIVAKDSMEKAIKKISILTRDINNYIAMSATDGKVMITSGDTDRGDAETELVGQITGEVNTIGLNGRYISDFIRNVKSADVTINIIDNTKPLIFTDAADDKYRYVIRPLSK